MRHLTTLRSFRSYRPCLTAFECSRDLVSNWGCERLYGPIRHDRGALARRTHLTNHHNRNACGLNGRQASAILQSGKSIKTAWVSFG